MKTLLFTLLFVQTSLLFAQDFSGKWYGNLVLAGKSFDIGLEIINNTASESALIQTNGDKEFPMELSTLEINGAAINFSIPSLGINYSGKLLVENITGDFSQGPFETELVFFRNKPEQKVVNRPQTPKAPFNYITEDITYSNKVSGNKIGATLTLPTNKTDFPVVILASGSGPQDRDEEIMGHKPFFVIADHFAKNGIAVLRFDDRGVKESEGSFTGASIKDFSTDVGAGLVYLRKRFPENKIGIIGHSEGGMHSLVLSRKEKIDFLGFMACVGSTGLDVLAEQNYLISMKDEHATTEDAIWAKKGVHIFAKALKDAKTKKESYALVSDRLNAHYLTASEYIKKEMSASNYIMALNQAMNNDYGREFLSFDASDYLKKYKGPFFAINGTEDIQVPSKLNLTAFEQNASKKSNKKGVIIKSYDGLNHLFQKCEKCTLVEYGELEETISTKVLDNMTAFVLAITKD